MHQLGLKFGKVFHLGGTRELEPTFNLLNVLNRASATQWLSNQRFSPNYLLGGNFQAPRSFQTDITFRF